MPRLTPEQRLAKAKEDLVRARSEINDRDRKNDTRRKIILGAILIERAKINHGVSVFIKDVIKNLERPSDKAAFEGWEPEFAPEPAKPPAPAASARKSE